MESIEEMKASLHKGDASKTKEMKKSLTIAGKSYSPQRLKEELNSLHYPRKRVFEKV